jgi:hypothetical protein
VFVGFIPEDPLISKNPVSFGFIFVDGCPGLENVDMFVDVVIHGFSELFAVLMAF